MIDTYIALDLETTGLSPSMDRILEIGAVKVVNGQILETYETLVNPERKIEKRIEELTGITDEMASEGIDTRKAVTELVEFCGDLPLLGHNILFDYSFVKQNAMNLNLTFDKEGIDTLKLARKFLPDAERKSLDYLCEILHIDHGRKHRALDDAEATARLLWYLWETFGDKEPQEFEAKPLHYKVKKQQPASERQKRRLKELAEYHRIDIGRELDSLTRSEASRMTDKIIFSCGRITK